ncbi:MAG: hypothetical protein H7241_08015 [Novosphingobium sp.]|nr:hypothetical protein [Novosphingobium sp.]
MRYPKLRGGDPAHYAAQVARQCASPVEALGALAFARYGTRTHDVRAFSLATLKCVPRRLV